MDEGEFLDIAGSVAGKNAVTQLAIVNEQTITLRHIIVLLIIQAYIS